MMELSYPSDTFPGPPQLGMTFPDTWVGHPAASAVISAVDQDSPSDFGTNVVVIVSRILNEHPLEEMVGVMWSQTTARYPAAEQLSSSRGTTAGHPSATTVIALRPPDTPVAVAQVQTILFVPTSDPVQRDLIQLHGTCTLDTLATYQTVFESIFASLTVA
jgi:hypothetical protein